MDRIYFGIRMSPSISAV